MYFETVPQYDSNSIAAAIVWSINDTRKNTYKETYDKTY